MPVMYKEGISSMPHTFSSLSDTIELVKRRLDLAKSR